MSANSFQVKLSGVYRNHAGEEDRILKRAYLAGFSHSRYTFRGQQYEVDFKSMTQRNLNTGKVREIRPPYKWTPPASTIVKKGPTFCIKVPPHGPGTIIHVPHPKVRGQMIAINVPPTAKVGQAMLVPLPQGKLTLIEPNAAAAATVAEMTEGHAKDEVKKKWSTCKKVTSGIGGAAVVGGLAVGGAILGEHIAEEGWDSMIDELGEPVVTTAEHIYDCVDAAADATEDAVSLDFIMDLF